MCYKSIVTSLYNKYYSDNEPLRHILQTHSTSVALKSLQIASLHPSWNIDTEFLCAAAMLHDIGIVKTNAPSIQCFGTAPYIQHGMLGAKMMRQEGLNDIARVCERHTGTGITAMQINRQNLPLPLMDYVPETLEEKIICFADKFFSKTHLEHEKTVEEVERSLAKFGDDTVATFRHWCLEFLK